MSFEEQLLMDLKVEFAARDERRRRTVRRISVGAAVAGLAAAAAIAVPLMAGTESPAYAVSKKAGGTVGVEIREFKDADQLERDLRAAGVRADITYLESGKQCEKNRGKSGVLAPDGLVTMREGGLDIKPRLIDEDKTLVLEFSGKQDDEKEPPVTGKVFWKLATLLIPGDVGPCVVIDDPQWDDDGSDTSGQPPAGS
ncbi:MULTISPECIES: hypothetical protein [unclassified Streptosporangium]|uniref:hypothetical protein n=1 Tax=unclassified Streptosporangium TaxID=2632669 RepID=UPI002E2DD70C|nr:MULTISPECIES: hypothetical protein [unclassified Streptosporangium]